LFLYQLKGSYVVFRGKLLYEQCIDRGSLQKLEKAAAQALHPMVFLHDKACYANADEHPYIVESFNDLKLEGPS
jgi:hypothetical protein